MVEAADVGCWSYDMYSRLGTTLPRPSQPFGYQLAMPRTRPLILPSTLYRMTDKFSWKQDILTLYKLFAVRITRERIRTRAIFEPGGCPLPKTLPIHRDSSVPT